MFRKFLMDESGATAIEYGILASLIGLVIVTGATLLGDGLNAMFSDIASKLPGAKAPPAPKP